MTKRLLAILFSLPLFTLLSFSQKSVNDNLLRDIVRNNGQVEVTISEPGIKAMDWLSGNTSISSVKDKTVHIVLSPLTLEWFISQNFDYNIVERTESKGIISSVSMKQALGWDMYPTYSQYDSIMRSFLTTYPDLCQLHTIGTSINGKLIQVLKISDNASVEEDEPEVFYSSSIHGDETGGFVLMLRFADYLLKNYSIDSRVKNLVDNLEIWINPLANPDGTYNSGDLIASPVRFNANGYDLNRNFPDPETPYTSSNIKQKETLDMIRFMSEHNFVLSANFHSGDEVVNYPWDRWPRLHADDSWFYNVSRKYADTVHFYSGPVYMTGFNDGITNGAAWYKINGGRQDFMTYDLHGREVTVELDDNWITPSDQLNSLWQYNWHSLIGYLENATYGIHGGVVDINTKKPVAARVFITGHDKDNSQVFSDTLAGSFTRLIAPGSWDLLFTANGYRDTLISNILVSEGQKTLLNVEMKPIPVNIPLLYPNPVSQSLKIILPENISGEVNITIFNQSGIKMTDFNTKAVLGIPVVIDVSHMAAGLYNILITNRVKKISNKARFVVLRR